MSISLVAPAPILTSLICAVSNAFVDDPTVAPLSTSGSSACVTVAKPVTERLLSISTVPNAAPRERLPLTVSTLLLVTLTVPDLNWVDVVTPETEIFLANVAVSYTHLTLPTKA